jgi:hypothetical protein
MADAEEPPEPLEPPYAKTPFEIRFGAAFEAVLNQALVGAPYTEAAGTLTYAAYPVATVIAFVAE